MLQLEDCLVLRPKINLNTMQKNMKDDNKQAGTQR
jgi:hypothetical protein